MINIPHDEDGPKPRRNKHSLKFTQDNEARRRSRETIGTVPSTRTIPDKRKQAADTEEMRAAKSAPSASDYLLDEDPTGDDNVWGNENEDWDWYEYGEDE